MNLLVLGGNSDIGVAVARQFAEKEGAHVTLASRNLEEIEKKAADIALRGQVKAKAVFFDVVDFENHGPFYESLDPKPDVIITAFGFTNDQKEAQRNFDTARKSIDVNFTGAVGILEKAALDFEQKGRGCIIGISSVAGDRGRGSNYIYGSAKAGFSAYLSGLRNRLFKSGVHVLTVKPGFVRTKMTAGMDLPEKLTLSPETVAEKVYMGFRKKRNRTYITPVWFFIMTVIKHIPEGIFKRLNL